ncbi:hypothetical protein SESBI_50763 [Sesbania bispinosa]|nr:hypothetical protein SESBI_50763 [Sesbania bispinosa]
MYDSLKPVVLVGGMHDNFFASFFLGWGITILSTNIAYGVCMGVSSNLRIRSTLGNENWGDIGALQVLFATFHCIMQYAGLPNPFVEDLVADHSLRLQTRRVTHQVVLASSDREKLASSIDKFAQNFTKILEVCFSYYHEAYNTDKMVATEQVASKGMVLLSYIHMVSEKVSLGFELMCNYLSRDVTTSFEVSTSADVITSTSASSVSAVSESSSLFLMHDVGKSSTTKLVWKPSREPFNFGNFGSLDPPFSCNLKMEEEGRGELCCDLPSSSTLQHLKEIAYRIDTNKTRILSIDGGDSKFLLNYRRIGRTSSRPPLLCQEGVGSLEIESDDTFSAFEDRFSVPTLLQDSLRIAVEVVIEMEETGMDGSAPVNQYWHEFSKFFQYYLENKIAPILVTAANRGIVVPLHVQKLFDVVSSRSSTLVFLES